jgi:hypothetical protein
MFIERIPNQEVYGWTYAGAFGRIRDISFEDQSKGQCGV